MCKVIPPRPLRAAHSQTAEPRLPPFLDTRGTTRSQMPSITTKRKPRARHGARTRPAIDQLAPCSPARRTNAQRRSDKPAVGTQEPRCAPGEHAQRALRNARGRSAELHAQEQLGRTMHVQANETSQPHRPAANRRTTHAATMRSAATAILVLRHRLLKDDNVPRAATPRRGLGQFLGDRNK